MTNMAIKINAIHQLQPISPINTHSIGTCWVNVYLITSMVTLWSFEITIKTCLCVKHSPEDSVKSCKCYICMCPDNFLSIQYGLEAVADCVFLLWTFIRDKAYLVNICCLWRRHLMPIEEMVESDWRVFNVMASCIHVGLLYYFGMIEHMNCLVHISMLQYLEI